MLGARRELITPTLVPVPEGLRSDGQVEGDDLRQGNGDDPVQPGAGTAASLTDLDRHAAIIRLPASVRNRHIRMMPDAIFAD
jgi:hypothetical protein